MREKHKLIKIQVFLQIWTLALALITPPSILHLIHTDSCLPSTANREDREACDTARQHVPNASNQSFSTVRQKKRSESSDNKEACFH